MIIIVKDVKKFVGRSSYFVVVQWKSAEVYLLNYHLSSGTLVENWSLREG